MPGCGVQSRPKLAEIARYNSLLKTQNKVNNNNSKGSISHSPINSCLFQSNTAYLNSLMDLCCIIVIFEWQGTAF